MSEIVYNILISDLARRDIRDILSYTQQEWGGDQRLVYKQKIDQAVQSIRENPLSKRVTHGLYVHRFGHHLVFYEVSGVTISIVRILHERMDVPDHL